MQTDRDDGFSPPALDYSEFVNDNESLHMFNTDSPSAMPMSIDPSSVFLNDNFTASPLMSNSQPSFSSPGRYIRGPLEDVKQEPPAFGQSPLQPRSALSSASPESSSHDSSSESSGRRKRKSPDSSSPSNLFESYPSQQTWRGNGMVAEKQKRAPELDLNMQFINSEMQNNFDFKSAASSPKGFSRQTPTATTAGSNRDMPTASSKNGMFTFGAPSRDNSPPSATFAASHQVSPSVLQSDYSMFADASWAGMTPSFGMDASLLASPPSMASNPALTVNPNEVRGMPHSMPMNVKLHVNKIPPKSRVETQIAIKLTLDPLPQGITKLHLPTQSISKAKLLAKEALKAPDTLELSTMLVCTSAMQNPENKERALRVARGELVLKPSPASRRSSNDSKKDDTPVDPNDPNLPQNGGEVKICDNCINRERKRAARKKQRKQEEEDIWNSYEKERVIVFNTAEYQSFHSPTPGKEESPDAVTAFSTDAMQIDAPMRIACYCRHMNEKVGFQVIFTVKDYQGRVIAQTMTQSIHITDDHKTHGVNPSQDFGYSDQQQFNLGEYAGGDPSTLFHANLPHRQYHSTTDLTALQRNMAAQAQFGAPFSQTISQGSSSGHHRTLSRPASPSAQTGPKKKRKGSAGQPKVPPGLMMTRADQQQPQSQPQALSIPDTTSAFAATSASFSPESIPFTASADGAFALPSGPVRNVFDTGPPTPNSNMFTSSKRSGSAENLGFFYSAPNSAHPSRAASPTSFSRSVNTFGASQGLPTTSTTFGAMQTESQQQHAIIHKILPGEGPVTGGIEVTCLGKNFHRGLEVMFGDNLATTTTHWGESTLVCLLPPSAISGPVNVTFAHQHQPGYSPPQVFSPPVLFKYIDDRDNKLFETCIRVLSAKQGGPSQDPRLFAQQVINDTIQSAGYGGAQTSGFGAQMMAASNKEEILLTVLERIDMDDSPHEPNFDLQSSTGQTMLTLACSLGYLRLVSGLLARGADPDLADVGGFTPLMIAALHNRPQIVRRLILKGADASKRNLKGFTAADLAASVDVSTELRQVRHHVRSVSAGTPMHRSRANSAASTRSLWGPPSSSASSSMFTTEDESAVDSDNEEFPPAQLPTPARSRRNSAALPYSRRGSTAPPLPIITAPATAHSDTSVPNTPYAIMAAWRDNLAAQIQLFQQNATLAMPNFQLPNLPPLNLQEPNFSGWRRLSSLVPHRPNFLSGSPPPEATDEDHEGSDWPGSDSTAAPPPAYGDIFPENTDMPLDAKPLELNVATEPSPTLTIRAPAVASSSVEQAKDTAQVRQRPQPLRKPALRIGKHTSEEQVAEMRLLRKEKLTSARDDRNLWYIWFPLLVLLVIWWYSSLSLPAAPAWANTGLERIQNRFRPTGRIIDEVAG